MKSHSLFSPAGRTGFCLFLAAALACAFPGRGIAAGNQLCHHDLKVEILPAEHRLNVRDDIQIEDPIGGKVAFSLSDKSSIESVLVNGKPSEYSFQSGKLTLPAEPASDGSLSLTVSFNAIFDDPVDRQPADFDNPGFGVVGSISEKGTFLLSDSGWYPGFAGGGEDFRIQVTAPRGIYAVTAGELIGHEDRGEKSISEWKTGPIGQGLSLSAARYIVRSKKDGRVPIYTYFTPETDSLSSTYLNASARHIAFYENLHGPYPFPKFAVVENFFPTGYGFPSYTLLGTTVLKLPFIPETSLRHEIAHSWWGNGVLVDYTFGNWCEGLTTYVADYLSQEITSARDARLYRLQLLRDYALLVSPTDDFPLRRFQSRISPATRAVGYGKAAFVFHMVRQEIGDEPFWKCLRQIYRERLFQKTTWTDFRDVFVRTGGWDAGKAKVFFDQWVNRSGAPVLRLEKVRLEGGSSNPLVTGFLLQNSPPYDLDIAIRLESSAAGHTDTKIGIGTGPTRFSIRSSAAPRELVVDPDVNVFRLLYPEEIPATVNSLKGSRSLVAVLSDGPPEESAKDFKVLLVGLDQAEIPIISESQAESGKDNDKDFLFFGLPRSEKLKSLFKAAPEGVILSPDRFSVKGFSEADCLFMVFGDGGRGGGLTALFLPVYGTDRDSVFAAVRKITHYGRYSFLTFLGGVIQEKGVWEVSHSPLEFNFPQQ